MGNGKVQGRICKIGLSTVCNPDFRKLPAGFFLIKLPQQLTANLMAAAAIQPLPSDPHPVTLFLRLLYPITRVVSNFSLSARTDSQCVPDRPAKLDTPLGSPDSLLLCKFQFIGRQGPPASSCLYVVQNPNLSPDTINNASNRAVMFGDCRITSHALPAGASRQTSI